MRDKLVHDQNQSEIIWLLGRAIRKSESVSLVARMERTDDQFRSVLEPGGTPGQLFKVPS